MAALIGATLDPLDTPLDLKPGEWVEVRDLAEILATLDERGRLSELSFMPEMERYCGRRFRVSRRADKACDRVRKSGNRRLVHAVHLEDLRCDGADHGGCGAACYATVPHPVAQGLLVRRQRHLDLAIDVFDRTRRRRHDVEVEDLRRQP